MKNTEFDHMQTDVSKAFREPSEIADAADLSPQQKVKLLRQWEFDLREIMVASEENMTAPTMREGQSAELLRKVRKVLIELGADHAEAAAPTKSGGA